MNELLPTLVLLAILAATHYGVYCAGKYNGYRLGKGRDFRGETDEL